MIRPVLTIVKCIYMKELFDVAKAVIPGGVNSPVRAFNAVGGSPVFVDRGEGAFIYDTDGQSYIDYVGGYGPLILGHAHPAIVSALKTAVEQGTCFGMPTSKETQLAQKVISLIPSIEQLRLVNSGTEATMSAIRLARAYTGREKIIKFRGCYHGHHDAMLIEAGSGGLTLGKPSSPGVTAGAVADTLLADYNDLDSVKRLFKSNAKTVAGIIVEPIAGNMNLVLPKPGFLEGLRQLADHYGALLIFDEVMTGFRVALGGAQQLTGVTPDLTTLGKVIGGGLPIGAFGGRRDIMQNVSPAGDMYQAGTLSGNPLAVTAGLATLAIVEQPAFHRQLEKNTQMLMSGMNLLAKKHGIAFHARSVGGMFGLYFTQASPVDSLVIVKQCDADKFGQFFHKMLALGVHFAPSAFEAGFMSAAHDESVIDRTLRAVDRAFTDLK